MYNYLFCSPIVTNCFFSGNYATEGGGMYNYASSALITNCTFSGNEAPRGGGGIYSYGIVSPTIINCTFSGNVAGYGGGMYNGDPLPPPTLTNCIFWGNTPEQIIGGAIVTYSDVQGGWSGTGNIDSDPCFVDINNPAGLDGVFGTLDDGFRLDWNSPCINTGDNNAVPSGITTDIKGDERIVGGVVDMGAYESYASRVVVMCWIDETEEGGYYDSEEDFIDDLASYRDEINSPKLLVVKSGCLVPAQPWDDWTLVLPEGYEYDPDNPPEGITVEDFNRPPGDVLDVNEFIDDFHRIRDGVIPDYLILIVDNSQSLGTSTINPYPAYPYTEFKNWIATKYPKTVIKPRDGANDFTNERWVNEMKIQVQSVIDDL